MIRALLKRLIRALITTDSFQKEMYAGACLTFGIKKTNDRALRLKRFYEEATEAMQAGDIDEVTCNAITRYVYSRPKGEINREFAQVNLSLQCAAEVFEINLVMESEDEYERFINNREKVRLKEAKKPEFCYPEVLAYVAQQETKT